MKIQIKYLNQEHLIRIKNRNVISVIFTLQHILMLGHKESGRSGQNSWTECSPPVYLNISYRSSQVDLGVLGQSILLLYTSISPTEDSRQVQEFQDRVFSSYIPVHLLQEFPGRFRSSRVEYSPPIYLNISYRSSQVGLGVLGLSVLLLYT